MTSVISDNLCSNFIDTLGTFYDDGGRAIRFANLFDEISHSVPHEKIDQLKNVIQSKKGMIKCI